MDQRKLMDNANTITDMAKVRIISANDGNRSSAYKAWRNIATASGRERDYLLKAFLGRAVFRK